MLNRLLQAGLVLMWLVGSSNAEEVYRSDFSKGVSPEIWSSTATQNLEPGGERVLGHINHQGSTAMTLKKLPAHALVRVRFDLLLIGQFDGQSNPKTYDGFSINLKDGPLLSTTNFSTGEAGGGGRQAFPDEFPSGNHPAQTGRVAGDKDAHRYHFDFTFPHNAKELTLFMRGRVTDQQSGWAFSNVRVDVSEKVNDLPADRADKLWKSFSGKDPIVANRALWDFIACGQAGLQAVEKRWKETSAKSDKLEKEKTAAAEATFEAAMVELGDGEFVNRQKASAEIGQLGLAVLPLIEKALADKKNSPEIRSQLSRLKKRLSAKSESERGLADTVASRIASVQRVLDQSRAGMRVSSSRDKDVGPDGWDGPSAVIDGFVPPKFDTIVTSRFTWYPKFIGDGWLRIDLAKEKEISAFGVFWFFDRWGTSLPASWKLDYLAADGKTWKPVENPSAYGLETNKFNEVTFDKVKTKAVRLTATFDGEKSTGIHEVYVK